MFGDRDWPLNASRGFVSISWASYLKTKRLTSSQRMHVSVAASFISISLLTTERDSTSYDRRNVVVLRRSIWKQLYKASDRLAAQTNVRHWQCWASVSNGLHCANSMHFSPVFRWADIMPFNGVFTTQCPYIAIGKYR